MNLENIKLDYENSKVFKASINESIAHALDLYEGAKLGNEVEGRSQIVWKLIKKQIKVLSPNISKPFLTGSDIVFMEPRTENDIQKKIIFERLLNYFWKKEFNRVKFVKSISNILPKEGTVFAKVDWERIESKNETTVPSLDQERIAMLKSSGFEVKSTDDGFVISKNKVIVNRPVSYIIPNEDVFTDPEATSLEDSRFIIYRYRADIDDIKSNPLFDSESISKWEDGIRKAQVEKDIDLHDTEHHLHNYDYTKPYIYEYWWKENGEIYYSVLIGECEEIILNKKKFDFDWFPFVYAQFYEKEFSIWGENLPDLIEDEQKFMTSVVRGVIDNMALSNNGIKFIKKGSLDSVNRGRLMRGEPFVEINATGSLRDAVMDGSFNELPASVYNMLQIIEQNAEGLTGVNKFMQGVGGREINSPASNFGAMMSQSQIRLIDVVMNVSEMIRQMMIRWLDMCLAYVDEDQMFQITGTTISEEKAKLTERLKQQFNIEELPEDVQKKAMLLIIKEVEDTFSRTDSKYDVNIKVGTDGLKEVKINQINMFMQQAAPLVQAGVVPNSSIRKLIARMAELLDFHDISKEIEEYEPAPDLMQQQLMQIQMQKELAEAKKSEALAQNAIARTKMTAVKAKKEELKIDPELTREYLEITKQAKEVNENKK